MMLFVVTMTGVVTRQARESASAPAQAAAAAAAASSTASPTPPSNASASTDPLGDAAPLAKGKAPVGTPAPAPTVAPATDVGVQDLPSATAPVKPRP